MKPEFSIVIPVYNEDESLRELLAQIKKSFSYSRKAFEIIFVDDGSTDRTLEMLQEFEKNEKNVKVYSFRRNMGKSKAMVLGFQMATGKYIATLDADLQDDPKNIRSMHEKMVKGNFDLVTGWRKNRKDSPRKVLSSRIFNNLVSFLFGVKVHDLNSGLKLYTATLAKDLKLYGGMHRFVPVIAHEMGYKIAEKETAHHPRKYGVSKYKFSKIFTDIPDLLTIYFLTKYNNRPLHFFGKIGSIMLGVGMIVLAYLTILRLFGERIGGRPLLLFGVLLVLAGLQTVLAGLVADLVVNFNNKDSEKYPIKYESAPTKR